MNELNCNSICHLLCCPPVPSKIAAKLAFMPPPASYELLSDETSGKLSFVFAPFMRETFMAFVPDNLEATTATTRRGNRIAIVYMRNNPSSKLTFLLSHGNAVDLGLMVTFMHELGTKLDVNMMCYDYSGYGASTGKPLEKNLYADAECALEVLQKEFGVPLRQVVLYGQSIGTVPTVHLATLYRVAAVVLHSPLMSGLRVAFPRLRRNYCCDVFSNILRAPRILSPTLIIHGLEDRVIHPLHAVRLHEKIPNVLEPLFIHGAGHNDCESFEEYLIRLEYLIYVELPEALSKLDDVSSVYESAHCSCSPCCGGRSGKNCRQVAPSPVSSGCETVTTSEPETVDSRQNIISNGNVSTSSWLRHKRGVHGSYRFIRRGRRKSTFRDGPTPANSSGSSGEQNSDIQQSGDGSITT
ncbi:hypothetical protein CRM22_003910 [Opisthorchis felineus]|uniref:Serine aminopeptidase S33 domain-containing protein n=1 Tax=Opisthorchis felineus TaxID=147828 RepID=A0A4S2LYY5_OPIFE|nr:hypothetical protein CRM22_003910 [Opisthorchis felineus]